MNDSLARALKQLRLSGLSESLAVRLQEAASHHLSHAEFLELILQDELVVRSDRLLKRRVKAAGFRELKTLDDFDWSFNPSIKKKQVFDLATARFVREHRDVLWLGPPGVGKSHVVQAVGYHAIKAGFLVLYRSIFDVVRDFLHEEALGKEDKILARYLKPDLLIIDDMGMKQLPKRSGEYLFEIIMRRYETRSTMMTSNRPLEDWGKLLGDVPSATAILDRFLHHAEIVQITGKSYRLRNQGKGPQGSNAAKAPIGSEEPTNDANAASAHGAETAADEANNGSNAAKAPIGSKAAKEGGSRKGSGGSRTVQGKEPADAAQEEEKKADGQAG
jgi:DNA replication protein DnaC